MTGEAVRAFVVVNDKTLKADDVVGYCRTQLTAYKVPKQIIMVDQLPKSPVGKILRAALRETSAAYLSRFVTAPHPLPAMAHYRLPC